MCLQAVVSRISKKTQLLVMMLMKWKVICKAVPGWGSIEGSLVIEPHTFYASSLLSVSATEHSHNHPTQDLLFTQPPTASAALPEKKRWLKYKNTNTNTMLKILINLTSSPMLYNESIYHWQTVLSLPSSIYCQEKRLDKEIAKQFDAIVAERTFSQKISGYLHLTLFSFDFSKECWIAGHWRLANCSL